MEKTPVIIPGNIFRDHRGVVRYANDFTLPNIKRFYTIENKDTKIVRAWQGHPTETKYFFAIRGKFVIAWVKIDNFKNPSQDLPVEYIILDANKEVNVLHISPGFANGVRSLEDGSILGVFSDLSLNESLKERVQFPAEFWFDWFQKFE